MEGKQDGDGKAQMEKVLKEIERYKAREISLCQKLAVMLPSLSLPASPSPSFCSLSDQLPLIKILTAALPGSPSSSPPRPPSLCFACHHVALSLCSFSFQDVVFLPSFIQQLKHLVFSFSSHLPSHLSTFSHLFSFFFLQTSIFASPPHGLSFSLEFCSYLLPAFPLHPHLTSPPSVHSQL